MRKIAIFISTILLMNLFILIALADNKAIDLNNKKLLEIETELKAKGYNFKVRKGTKVIFTDKKINKNNDLTSQIILLIYNLDTKKEEVYYLNYKEDNLVNVFGNER